MPAYHNSKKSSKNATRTATFAPTAIGAITARITAKIARKKPQLKLLALIKKNWRNVVPADFQKQAKPLKIVFAKHSYHTDYQAQTTQAKATLTIATTQGFAPIALHRADYLIVALNTYLGNEVIEAVKIKQHSYSNETLSA